MALENLGFAHTCALPIRGLKFLPKQEFRSGREGQEGPAVVSSYKACWAWIQLGKE